MSSGEVTDLSHRLFEKSIDLMDTGAPAECYEMYVETLDNGGKGHRSPRAGRIRDADFS